MFFFFFRLNSFSYYHYLIMEFTILIKSISLFKLNEKGSFITKCLSIEIISGSA